MVNEEIKSKTIIVIDCGITSCAYYDTCLTQEDREDNNCDENHVEHKYEADARTGLFIKEL